MSSSAISFICQKDKTLDRRSFSRAMRIAWQISDCQLLVLGIELSPTAEKTLAKLSAIGLNRSFTIHLGLLTDAQDVQFIKHYYNYIYRCCTCSLLLAQAQILSKNI